jgi:hypothetical protein
MKLHLSNGKLLGILGSIVVVAAVSTSIWINPPSENRARAFDQVRLRGLQSIELAINKYVDLHHALPVDLKVLEGENGLLTQQNWHDPVTKQPFEYEIISQNSYRLCANFSRNSDKNENVYTENAYDYQFKNHGAGRVCFQYSVRLQE